MNAFYVILNTLNAQQGKMVRHTLKILQRLQVC